MKLSETGVQQWTENDASATIAQKAMTEAPDVAWRGLSTAKRFKFLTADGQTATPLEQEALLDGNDMVEASFIDRCNLVMNCIGRIRFETTRGRGYATGFLIAPGLLMTNHHVFPNDAAARGASIEFDYRFDVAGQLPVSTDEYMLDPAAFFVSDASLDFSVVAVAEKSVTAARNISARGYLRLIPESGKAKEGDFVSIIQHPDGQPMQIALRENEVTRAKEDEPFLWYHADTAHGSSGAPVFNDTFQTVALHASGRIRQNERGEYARIDGNWVASLEGLQESDVIWEANVGYRISRICKSLAALARTRSPRHADSLAEAMRSGDVLSRAVERIKSGLPAADLSSNDRSLAVAALAQEKGIQETQQAPTSAAVPANIRITIDIGDGPATVAYAGAAAKEAASPLEAEQYQMRIPVIYDGLNQRSGFNAAALDEQVPAPMPAITADGQEVLAHLLDNSGSELKYRHFSVWMHKDRRLALYTASNVDWRARKKIVEGKSTERKALAGFPPEGTYAEQWVSDPRLAADAQLPDIFYTEDRGAFDKGHIVRRDDVCWGATYEEIQMANGDTFHVTNCSPQIKAFNQGPAGQENWGDLESHIQKATKTDNEKAIIYAGPILSPGDRWFRGKGDTGGVRVQIPNRFWKIVVVNGARGFDAYGFILSQDVRPITETEFFITEEWRGALKPISAIQAEMRGWLSFEALTACDRYEEAREALASS